MTDPVGRRLFAGMEQLARWQLISCTATDTGALWLTYRPQREKSA
ncbi:hypothetical protein [Branchiibius sp. NY16-3462-2]|nr:hypothetical protein [Branchiibius sp. NY16-3462-2]